MGYTRDTELTRQETMSLVDSVPIDGKGVTPVASPPNLPTRKIRKLLNVFLLSVAVSLGAYAMLDEDGYYKNYARYYVTGELGDEMNELSQQMLSENKLTFESTTATSVRTISMSRSDRKLGWSAERDPEIVWFMSFAASSADYFLYLIHESSGYTTGTNYGVVFMNKKGDVYANKKDSSSVFPGGPSYYTKKLKRSKKKVAIRTSGAGYCFFCHPKDYYFVNFFKASATGVEYKNGKMRKIQYDGRIVKKMVHLIRDPFDNIVARYYSFVRLMNKDQVSVTKANKAKYTLDPDGFQSWCKDQDRKFFDADLSFLPVRLHQLARKTPCRQEFIKYVKFHMNAMKMARENNIELLVVKFEDYVTHTDRIVKRVNKFIETPTLEDDMTTPFSGAGKWMFGHYYTLHQRTKISKLLKNLTSKELWPHIKVYAPYKVDMAKLYEVPDDDGNSEHLT